MDNTVLGSIVFDRAFENNEFKGYLTLHDIQVRPLPPRRHNKNALESKYRVLRDIFLRLQQAHEQNTSIIPDSTQVDIQSLLIQQSFRISNELYGNDTLSAYEMEKGYTRPVCPSEIPKPVPKELLEAHDSFIVRRKLSKILKPKAVTERPVSTGHSVQIFVKLENQTRGKWLAPTPIISYDHTARTIAVAGKWACHISSN